MSWEAGIGLDQLQGEIALGDDGHTTEEPWLMLRNYVRSVGVLAGLAVSTFSRTLAVLFGLLVVGVQVRVHS